MRDRDSRIKRAAALIPRITAEAWAACERLAPTWDAAERRRRGGGVAPLVNVMVCDASYRLQDSRKITLRQELPVMIDRSGRRIAARFVATDRRAVAGGRLRLALMVPVARPEGRVELALLPLESAFDGDGVAAIDVPMSEMGRLRPLPVGGRQWPSELRRLWVVLPD